jgi:hypothetical protein
MLISNRSLITPLAVEAFKNGFINLAIPFMTLSEVSFSEKEKYFIR